jgi:hypothetical protein
MDRQTIEQAMEPLAEERETSDIHETDVTPDAPEAEEEEDEPSAAETCHPAGSPRLACLAMAFGAAAGWCGHTLGVGGMPGLGVQDNPLLPRHGVFRG